MIEFKLAIPPSNNLYYRHVNNRVLLSKEGRAYKEYVKIQASAQNKRKMLDCSLRVELIIHARDNRRRDIDGFSKSVFDALTYTKVWRDDCLIDEMVVLRRENKKDDPHIIVRIIEL